MNLGLEGKVALVTGSARDIGREIALALAAEGATVAVNHRDSEAEAREVAEQITAEGGRARVYQADVADYPAVCAMVDGILSDFGRLDVLVNNAGFVVPKRFVDTTPEDWQRQIGVGLYGVIHSCHAAAPHMIEQKSGRIINMAGDSARVGESRLSVTGASRGGALSLTKSLAKELGPSGITVNAVALGLVETAHSDKGWLDAHMERIVAKYPLGRIGQPSDVAPTIAFLASEGAGWVTGQVISISGGYAMVG
jgi:NAD(P)-dependent dehydrogenase (short-subunit alcohol dehydrogenase family)